MIYAELSTQSAIIAYGVAAPFAAVCFWMVNKANKRAEDAEAEVKRLNEQMLERDEQLLFKVWKIGKDAPQDRDSR